MDQYSELVMQNQRLIKRRDQLLGIKSAIEKLDQTKVQRVRDLYNDIEFAKKLSNNNKFKWKVSSAFFFVFVFIELLDC